MAALPTLFVSHGAPTLMRDSVPAREFLMELGRQIPRPRAILCISAHWDTAKPTISGTDRPETIHDFYGFPSELYELAYPAPGDPAQARQVLNLLQRAGIPAEIDESRGLDHGAWIPLSLMYPDCNVPVLQLSVQSASDPDHHLAMGTALRPLRDQGVLVLGSGGATHNLREFAGQTVDAPVPRYVREFDSWLRQTITAGRLGDLLSYRDQAPGGLRNHPTPEHFLPIFVSAGAASEEEKGRQLHGSFTFGILSMAAYRWD